MFSWLKIQIDKWRTGNELTQWGAGHFYVLYPDGEKSTTMYYRTALEYAEIFGGHVYHYPSGKRLT